MRSFLSSLPNADLPDVAAEADVFPVPALPPDDDDLIRPLAEDELLRVHSRALTESRPTALAKYLIWTFGPDHQALPFHLQLRTEVEDDAVVSCDTEIGWLHRGLEKNLEGLTWAQGVEAVARLNPAAPIAPRLAWVLAVERLLKIDADVPVRAQVWRAIAAELDRVRAHLRVIVDVIRAGRGTLRALETTAARVGTLLEMCAYKDGVFTAVPGGLIEEPGPKVATTVKQELAAAVSPIHRVIEHERQTGAFTLGLEGKGRLSRPRALDLSLSGPALRATGMWDDVRAADPYLVYREHPPREVTEEGGDVAARLRVRLDEVAASSALALRLLSSLEELDGPACIPDLELPRDDEGLLTPPAGMFAASVEAPGGELSVMLVSDGGPRPIRARLCAPSFKLAAALGDLLRDARLDEVVPILQSLGLSGAEIDR
jgi:NADH-quinone oxidoreductase subunit D